MDDPQHPVCFQAHQDRVGSWPWCGPWEDGLAEARFRYSLTTLTVPRRCLGMARRRVGRGGRSVKFLFLRFNYCTVLWTGEMRTLLMSWTCSNMEGGQDCINFSYFLFLLTDIPTSIHI